MLRVTLQARVVYIVVLRRRSCNQIDFMLFMFVIYLPTTYTFKVNLNILELELRLLLPHMPEGILEDVD